MNNAVVLDLNLTYKGTIFTIKDNIYFGLYEIHRTYGKTISQGIKKFQSRQYQFSLFILFWRKSMHEKDIHFILSGI